METRIGDIKLIHHKNKPVVYARVEEIIADVKPGWWQIRLLILQVPAREVTWILRDEYIDGGEFTMDGEPMLLEPVAAPQTTILTEKPEAIDLEASNKPEPAAQSKDAESGPDDNGDDHGGGAKVVDLSSRRRNR
jgi:hypothetical protein